MVAVGCDIEGVARFKKVLKNKAFLSNVFTDGEIAYCLGKKRPEAHFAGKFACKEATFKALSSFNHNIPLKFIEIDEAGMGDRVVRIPFKKVGKRYRMSVSASCAKDIVFASSIAEKI